MYYQIAKAASQQDGTFKTTIGPWRKHSTAQRILGVKLWNKCYREWKERTGGEVRQVERVRKAYTRKKTQNPRQSRSVPMCVLPQRPNVPKLWMPGDYTRVQPSIPLYPLHMLQVPQICQDSVVLLSSLQGDGTHLVHHARIQAMDQPK